MTINQINIQEQITRTENSAGPPTDPPTSSYNDLQVRTRTHISARAARVTFDKFRPAKDLC